MLLVVGISLSKLSRRNYLFLVSKEETEYTADWQVYRCVYYCQIYEITKFKFWQLIFLRVTKYQIFFCCKKEIEKIICTCKEYYGVDSVASSGLRSRSGSLITESAGKTTIGRIRSSDLSELWQTDFKKKKIWSRHYKFCNFTIWYYYLPIYMLKLKNMTLTLKTEISLGCIFQFLGPKYPIFSVHPLMYLQSSSPPNHPWLPRARAPQPAVPLLYKFWRISI